MGQPVGGKMIEEEIEGVLTRFDEEKIVRETDLDRKAEDDGLQHKPGSQSSSITLAEQSIIDYLGGLVGADRTAAKAQISSFRDSMSGNQFYARIADIEHLDEKFEAELAKLKVQHAKELQTQYERERSLANGLRIFRRENKLQDRPAKTRKSAQIHWSIVLSMMVTEAILNSYFFSIGSEMGLIGGFLIAALLSFLNVVVAYWAGSTWLPKFNHVEPRTKVAGVFVVTILGLICLVISLGAAQYRVALEAFVETDGTLFEADRLAIDMLYRSPFKLESIQGFFLLTAGLVIATSAFWKAYRYDDPYPGYGELTRTLHDSEDETSHKEEQFVGLIEGASTQISTELDELDHQVRRCFQDYRSLLGACEVMVSEFDKHVNAAVTMARQLAVRYRCFNAEARDDPNNVPAWFDKPLEVDFSDLLLVENFDAEEQRLEQQEQKLADVHRELVPQMRERLLAIKSEEFKQLPQWFVECGARRGTSNASG